MEQCHIHSILLLEKCPKSRQVEAPPELHIFKLILRRITSHAVFCSPHTSLFCGVYPYLLVTLPVDCNVLGCFASLRKQHKNFHTFSIIARMLLSLSLSLSLNIILQNMNMNPLFEESVISFDSEEILTL
jgi:hypothetical protein